jgi:putative transposase
MCTRQRRRTVLVEMGYPIREENAGAYYHVGTRGNNKRAIYSTDTTRHVFLLMLGRLTRRHDWRVVAYCLMGNHYHLVLQLGDAGMNRGMQQLNSGYARWFNENERRRDHLFGRRYWSRELVDDDDLLETCRYIDANPMRSFGIKPELWPWSSYRAAAGLEPPARFHCVNDLWRVIHPDPREAIDAYTSEMATLLEGTCPVSDTGSKRPR